MSLPTCSAVSLPLAFDNHTRKELTTMRNLHQEITDRIVARLRDGVCPWRQPWNGKGHGVMPRNAVTSRAYSGVNVLILWSRAQDSNYSDPRWLTFKQALELGGNVRKGEKGETVIFVSKVIKEDKDGKRRAIPFLKAYTLFNVAQCDNLPAKIANPDTASHIVNPNTRDELADAFIASTGADLRHGEARAYYRPLGDYVNLPRFETFKNARAPITALRSTSLAIGRAAKSVSVAHSANALATKPIALRSSSPNSRPLSSVANSASTMTAPTRTTSRTGSRS